MAGKKGVSGSQNGVSNNPLGRPAGSKNKVQNVVKQQIEDFVRDNFTSFTNNMDSLEAKDQVKAYLELIRLVIPRPVSAEESDALHEHHQLVAKLFGQRTEETGNGT
jgi:hypothetical protein